MLSASGTLPQGGCPSPACHQQPRSWACSAGVHRYQGSGASVGVLTSDGHGCFSKWKYGFSVLSKLSEECGWQLGLSSKDTR